MKCFSRYTEPLLLASAILALTACGGGGGGSNSTTGGSGGVGNDTSSLSLAVTDAPVDSANRVVVEFTGVSIQPAEGDRLEFSFDEPRSIDLLALQGSASETLLSNEEVPAGDYEWILLNVNAENDGVTDSFLELSDGTMVELWVPAENGLRLVSGFNIAAGSSADFTIDFDLRKSVVLPPGNALGGAILKPALRLVDNTAMGAIAGRVDGELITEQCADPAVDTGAVYVFPGADATVTDVRDNDETDPVTTALVSDDSGMFAYEAGFLSEGDYTLAYTCDAANDDPEAEDSLTFVGETNASVEADSTTEVNFETSPSTP